MLYDKPHLHTVSNIPARGFYTRDLRALISVIQGEVQSITRCSIAKYFRNIALYDGLSIEESIHVSAEVNNSHVRCSSVH
jgi:hypothetical protein